jgi:hypothetical protein
MPRRHSFPRLGTAIERLDPAIDGTMALDAAMLKLALVDLDSPHDWLRQDARQFLRDEVAVTFWAEVGGLDADAVKHHIAAVLGPETARNP